MDNSVVGERILSLLSAKGMNQRSLSQATRLTESAISRYVSGEREPRGAILLCIANALGTSVEYLKGETKYTNPQGMNEELGTAYSILERNAASMSAEDKTKFAEVLFRSNVRTLKETPFVSVTSGVFLCSFDYDNIEKCLADMIEDLGLYQFPMDCFSVAAALSIECIPYSRLPHTISSIVTAMSADGISFMSANGNYVIYYSDAIDCHRIIFTIWHEIGHIQLGHIEKAIHKESCYLRMEAEANHFAHAAVVPTAFVIALHPQDANQIASAFNVSMQCAQYAFCTYMRIMQCSPQFIDYISNARISKLLTFNPAPDATNVKEVSYGR